MAPSKRTSFVALASTVAIAGVVATIAWSRAAGKRDLVVSAEAGSLRQCLLGGALRPHESRLDRLRAVEIGQTPADADPERTERWPLRCEQDAARLARLLGDGPPGYARGARARLLTLTEGLFSPDAGTERSIAGLATRLDAWEAEIVAAGLPSNEPEAELEPGAALYRAPELSAPLPMSTARLGVASQYGHAGLLLRADEPDRVIAVVDAKTRTARTIVARSETLPPFSASGDATSLFLPRAQKTGLSLVDDRGGTVWPGPGVVFAHATATGGSYVACDETDGCRLVVVIRRGDGYEERSAATLPRDETHTLVNGVLVSRAKSEDPETLFVALPDQGVSPRVALAPKLAPWLRLRACRTPRHTVLAVQGSSRTTFFFHDGSTWSDGVAAEAPEFDSIAGPPAQLGCDENGASIASREDDKLVLLRCTPQGCERHVTRALPGGRDLVFAAIGEKLFTARVVDGAGGYRPVRSVWFRFGAPASLHANESLLLGDDEHGGHGVGWLGAYPIADGAVLALSALGSVARGTYLVSVDLEGRFAKIAFD